MKDSQRTLAFTRAVNSRLAPVLRIVRDKRMRRKHFELELKADDEFVMKDQVVVNTNGNFRDMIRSLSIEYFGVEAKFNNTGRIFWI